MVAFNYGGHILIGSLLALFVCHSAIDFMIIILCSLLPDVDHRNSTLGRYNPFTPFMKHRGHCHSLIGVSLLCLPFILVNENEIVSTQMYMLAVVSSIAHLFGDKISSALKGKEFKIKVW